LVRSTTIHGLIRAPADRAAWNARRPIPSPYKGGLRPLGALAPRRPVSRVSTLGAMRHEQAELLRARQNFATQLVDLRVGAGAVLEYLPDPIVPFRCSRLFQRVCVRASGTPR
jgi:UreD urease accessory protein